MTINVDPQSHVRDLGAYFMRRANAGQTNAARHRDHREPLPAVDVQRLLDARLRALGAPQPAARHARPRHGRHRPATYLTSYAEGILSFLDGVMSTESAAALDQRMEDATPFESNTHSSSGFEDNPRR